MSELELLVQVGAVPPPPRSEPVEQKNFEIVGQDIAAVHHLLSEAGYAEVTGQPIQQNRMLLYQRGYEFLARFHSTLKEFTMYYPRVNDPEIIISAYDNLLRHTLACRTVKYAQAAVQILVGGALGAFFGSFYPEFLLMAASGGLMIGAASTLPFAGKPIPEFIRKRLPYYNTARQGIMLAHATLPEPCVEGIDGLRRALLHD